MTRNDAYKAARRAWRFWFRRGCREYQSATENALAELRVSGHSSRDVRMVALWIKALRNGRRWPDEADMRRIESAPD